MRFQKLFEQCDIAIALTLLVRHHKKSNSAVGVEIGRITASAFLRQGPAFLYNIYPPMKSLSTLFAYKSWADNELFNLLATVDSAKYSGEIHTSVRVLNHVYVVDKIFQTHLIGGKHSYSNTNTETTPELEELQFSIAESDSWFEKYVGVVSEENLRARIEFRFAAGDAGTMTREEMLLHVITHGAYHRGNVGQVLKSIAISPPADLYTRFLHISEPKRRQIKE